MVSNKMQVGASSFLVCLGMVTFAQAQPQPVYLDSGQSIDLRVEDLLERMTLEEKVAQVNAISIRGSAATQEGYVEVDGSLQETLKNGIGQIENTFDPRLPRQSVEQCNALQQHLIDHTRLKIPALIGSECLHGHAAYNSTVFPTPLAMASSWNPALVEKAFDITGRESRLRGNHEAHTPVLDIGRDPRWGRIEETYGEDTYLVSQMAVAIVSGLQGGRDGNPGTTHIVSAPKHFAGYGQVVGGRNFAATPIETKTLYDDILPPFEAAVKEANALGMMASHCDVGGVPAHGNHWLLTELLKQQWGFEGMIVSDYMDIKRLEEFHHVAATVDEAARMALMAGMDLDLPSGKAYGRLVDIIHKDPSLMVYLDESVRRIFRLKFMLGLFENPFNDPDRAVELVGCEAHVQVAEQLACESIVMLKNEAHLLPLNADRLKSIAVVGPNATSDEMGTYTVKNDFVVNMLDGIRRKVGTGVRVGYEEGCKIAQFKGNDGIVKTPLSKELPKIQKAVDLAARSDVAIVCVGGNTKSAREAFYRPGVRGDRSTLGLLGNQKELVMRVVATGTPTIVVLMGGRPYAIPEIAEQPCAILNTFYLGQCNGTALAKVLFGDVNPSGKLPVSMVRSVGQLPLYYSQKEISFYKDYWEEKTEPLFPFGFGLSYTSFAYSDLTISEPVAPINKPFPFSVKVKNTGDVAGAEVVQVYFRDKVASVTRPVKRLVRFKKIFLEPGQEEVLHFELEPAKDLSFTGADMNRVVEPGEFILMVGPDSAHTQDMTFKLIDQRSDATGLHR